jgi:hypothetical protein
MRRGNTDARAALERQARRSEMRLVQRKNTAAEAHLAGLLLFVVLALPETDLHRAVVAEDLDLIVPGKQGLGIQIAELIARVDFLGFIAGVSRPAVKGKRAAIVIGSGDDQILRPDALDAADAPTAQVELDRRAELGLPVL